MSKKIEFTKEELKSKDTLSQGLAKGFEWTAQHSRMTLTFLLLFIVVGGGWAIFNTVKKQTEDKLKESYFLAEKTINDIRSKHDEAQRKANEEKNKTAAKDKTKKAPEAPVVLPALTIEKDFQAPMVELKKLVDANPSSVAASMAGLKMVDLYRAENKLQEALKAIEPITSKNQVNHMMSALVFKAKGNLQADLDLCQDAIQTWEALEKSGQAKFIISEVKFSKSLCFEHLGDTAKAETILQELSASNAGDVEDTIASEAKKNLRLLNFKKETK